MGGLTYGLSAWFVRVLCDNPMEGGFGYTPNQVGDMTVDQVLMLMADRKMLKHRTKQIESLQMAQLANARGEIRGVAADGTEMRAHIRGKSKARALMEAAQARLEEKGQKKSRWCGKAGQ